MHYLVHHFLEDSARRRPDKTALICGERRLSYRQIDDAAGRLALRLTDMGVARRDRVALFMDNSVEAVIALFAVLKADAVFVIPSASMKPKKLGYILKDSGARVLIAQSAKAPVALDAVGAAEGLEHILWCGEDRPPGRFEKPCSHSWQWEDPAHLQLQSRIPAARSIDLDLAAIIYTSGSTGEPKGVMSAHGNMLAAVRSITGYLENREDDIVLCALPLSFDYGLYQVLMGFFFGGTVVLEKSFAYPYQLLEKIVRERVTGLPLVPTMAAMLLQMDLSRFDFGSLRYITNTAAALPQAYIRRLQALFPHVRIFSMYGLTECKRVSFLPPDELERRPDSVGIPIPNEEVFILDDNGREVEPGGVGELVVRGANVMLGYWNAPDQTSQKFRKGPAAGDRFLYTGDLFRRDAEGFLYFVGRKDDLIKTRGERVSPKEIENALCELEGVAEAAVIGVPDELLGQAVKAILVLRDGCNLTNREVQKHCARNLEPFMLPKYIEFRESLPRTSSGKVDKLALAAASSFEC